jgi:class 3 adenylate cyclase/CHASE2 domain-containing sensor protein
MSRVLSLSTKKNRTVYYVIILSVIIILLVSLTGLFKEIDKNIYDICLGTAIKLNPAALNPRIVRVDLNDTSEKELEEAIGSRAAFADIIEVLAECGSQPAFDFMFKYASQNDKYIAEAALGMESVIFAVTPVPGEYANFAYENITDQEKEILARNLWHIKIYGEDTIPLAKTFIMSNPEISNAASRLGHIGVEPDSDGLYRRTPLFYRWENGLIPSLSLAAAIAELRIDPENIELYPGKELVLPLDGDNPIKIPVDKSGYVIIPYTSTWADDSYRVSFSKVVSAKYNDAVYEELFSELNGSIALVADTTTSKKDFGITPFETVYPLSGIHASIISGILNDYFYRTMDQRYKIIILCLCTLAIIAIGFCKKDTLYHIGFLALFLVFWGNILILWIRLKIIPWASVVSTEILVFWAVGFIFRLARRYKEKFQLQLTFSRYLSPDVIKEVMENPDRLKLGGDKRNMTAIFTDIQGFSTISELIGDPQKLVELLNVYLSNMSDIILDNKGTIDKYEGDAIIGFFGAPIETAQHAVYACRSAILIKKREQTLNRELAERNLSPKPIFTRIGINSGVMVVGNMGTEKKMDYTIIGNAVNLASRLEGVNKQYFTGGILISEYTKNLIGGEFIYRSLDRIRVVGINTPVRIYELLDIKNEASAALLVKTAQWEKALSDYEDRKFDQAIGIFTDIFNANHDDGVAQYYIQQCKKYVTSPPPEDWDGVNNLTQK